VGAEFFHADGQTDMTKLMVAFSNFANALKKRRFDILMRTKTLLRELRISIR